MRRYLLWRAHWMPRHVLKHLPHVSWDYHSISGGCLDWLILECSHVTGSPGCQATSCVNSKVACSHPAPHHTLGICQAERHSSGYRVLSEPSLVNHFPWTTSCDPVAKALNCHSRGPGDPSLVRELVPTHPPGSCLPLRSDLGTDRIRK